MALFTSPIVAGASGSIGGAVYSRNRFGQYIRTRAVPVNPSTSFQQVVRNALTQLVTRWTETLTQAQRDAWDVYGVNVPVVNKVGNSVNLTGQNWYIGNNTPRLQAGMIIVDAAPTIFDRGTFDPPLITIDATADEIDVAFDNTFAPYNETDAALLVYVGRPVNPSVNFFKGPYRFAGAILGNTVTPPSSPATFPLPFPVAAGNKVGVRVKAVRADGRASTDFPLSAIAV